MEERCTYGDRDRDTDGESQDQSRRRGRKRHLGEWRDRARVARAGRVQTKPGRALARVAPAGTKAWPGGRGQRWRRPPRARANYKSQQLPQRPSAGPSRSPGAPGGAAGPRGPPAGLAGGGVSCKPGAGRRRLASAGAAGPGRGEGHRVSDPESGSGRTGEGWAKGGGGWEEAPTLRAGCGARLRATYMHPSLSAWCQLWSWGISVADAVDGGSRGAQA